MSIEAIVANLRAAYRALSKDQQSGPELDLSSSIRMNEWRWKHEDEFKQRFFDCLPGRLGIEVKCIAISI